jgi:decaprenyl-phosphate phosphoribosyltransferase
VLAAPTAAGRIGWPSVALEVAGAFVALCLVSSATYLLNDVRDREQDRLHEKKRLRPVASGELSVAGALRAAALLALAGLALAFAIAPGLALLAAGYMAMTASYSLWLRRIAILDMLVIAAGFVLRAFAGGVASDIYLSRWFVIVTACGAVFLVAAKRLAELRQCDGARARASLRRYSSRGLIATLALVAMLASAAYVGWALTRPAHMAWYACSIAPFLGWLARYAQLIARGAGQAPEELILRDRVLLALSAGWTILFVGGVYAWS